MQVIPDTNTLNIFNAESGDSGSYSCEASNGYAQNSASTVISVQDATDVPVQAECVDNPYFANCKLIVRAQYCTNKYYAKFCCRSCTLAGQI